MSFFLMQDGDSGSEYEYEYGKEITYVHKLRVSVFSFVLMVLTRLLPFYKGSQKSE